MTEVETRLERALAADSLPASDALFRIQVIIRQQRTAARRQLAEAIAFACGGAVLAALVFRAVNEVVQSKDMRLIVIAVLAMGYVFIFMRRYVEVPLSVHALSERIRSVISRY